jgi:hypothetical protein
VFRLRLRIQHPGEPGQHRLDPCARLRSSTAIPQRS